MTAKTLAGHIALRNFDFNGQLIRGGDTVSLAEMSAEDAAPFLAVGVVAPAFDETPEEPAAADAGTEAAAIARPWSSDTGRDD